MKKWIIPYIDQDVGFWKEINDQFGADIHSVYFPMPGKLVASGRPAQPDQYMMAFLNDAPLNKTVLVNPILLPRPVEELAPVILNGLYRLRDSYGVEHVTLANANLAAIIKDAIPEMKITGSTLMGISTPAQALMVSDCLDALVPDTRILRDLEALQRLKNAFPGEIRLIVNEACLPGCPYRLQHFYEMGYGQFYPQSLCRSLLTQKPWLRLTTGWVLPQHLHYYEGLYDTLKLAGRVTLREPATYLRVLGAYLSRAELLPSEIGGGPAGVIRRLDVSDEHFERMLACDKDCGVCGQCQEYYSQNAS